MLRVFLFFSLLPLLAAAEEEIIFNRDIRPILSDKCFYCHGPDKGTREADLRLDLREAAIEGEAIAPGDLKASELYWRITSDDEDELMPPPESHKSLTKAEIALLNRWVEEGAESQDHWSYLPIERPAESPPGAKAIDHFVDERLAAEGLGRSERADQATLLRRLHFDITGLPPLPKDREIFETIGIDAYVDQLLASPHYGERMAMEWLDAVRYADSVGYHGDQSLEASPYRDWVIAAFNRNQPFDQFTIDQIAGDLLPEATLDQRVAAAYNRLGQISAEGGIQDAEYLVKYQAERVRTTATAWLGATLACAECHDHKFDPYTAKDFYQFAAFFSDILEKGAWNAQGSYQEEAERYATDGVTLTGFGPSLKVPSTEERERLEELAQSEAEAREELAVTTPELRKGAQSWAVEIEEQIRGNEPVDHVFLRDKGEKHNIETKGWDFVARKEGPVHEGAVALRQKAAGLTQQIARLQQDPIRITAGDEFFVHVFLDPDNAAKQVMLQLHGKESSWNHRAWWGKDLIPYGKGTSGPKHHRIGDLPVRGEWVRLSVPVESVGLAEGDEITEIAFTQFDGLVYWDSFGIRTENESYRWESYSAELLSALQKDGADRSESEENLILAQYRRTAPELAQVRERLVAIEEERKKIDAKIRTVPATISAKRREVRILPRGNWMDKSGEVVVPGTPHFLPAASVDVGETLDRLDLARWIVSPENPLTARTFVNRLWARFFGDGISNAVEDLGSQGGWPSHPELLDSLAADFVESGWDMKQLVKTIVLSETCQQASDKSPELEELDPYNRLLARQSAIRLPAELVRDNSLAVSGLLNPTIGGRSVRPYQPAGYYQHLNFPKREYKVDLNAEQHRRGVYSHWQRTFLHPAMKAFDAPSREECTMERETSSTPLQALVLLNDPSFVEAARALAIENATIPEMFAKTLTRQPDEKEVELLERLYASERARFTAEPNYADGLLAVGMIESPETDLVDLAARTSVARAILNLHETITRY